MISQPHALCLPENWLSSSYCLHHVNVPTQPKALLNQQVSTGNQRHNYARHLSDTCCMRYRKQYAYPNFAVHALLWPNPFLTYPEVLHPEITNPDVLFQANGFRPFHYRLFPLQRSMDISSAQSKDYQWQFPRHL